MTEKVMITQEQAEAIEHVQIYHIKTHLVRGKLNGTFNGLAEVLNTLSDDAFMRALYIGYEVEVKFKVGDWLTNTLKGVVFNIEVGQEDNLKGFARKMHLRHATDSEIAQEKERRMENKLDKLLLGLSSLERDILFKKLLSGDPT